MNALRAAVLLVASLTFATAAHADTLLCSPGCVDPVVPRGARFDRGYEEETDEAMHRALSLRNTGIIMTVVGVIGVTVGAVLFRGVGVNPDSDGSIVESGAGMAIVGLSAGALLAGVPMLAVGAAREAKLKRSRFSASASGLGVRF
jgi:hypothetical protein